MITSLHSGSTDTEVGEGDKSRVGEGEMERVREKGILVILPGIQKATAGELARCQERMREGGDERLRWVEGGRLRVGEGVRLRA